MDASTTAHGFVKSVEAAGDVQVERAIVGLIGARDVSIRQAGAGPISAHGNMNIEQGGCGPALVRGDLSIRQGGCGPSIVGGNLSIQQGGTQSVIAAGGATLGRGAFAGAVVSPKVTIEDGARVLIATPIAFVAGAAAGVLAMLVARRRR